MAEPVRFWQHTHGKGEHFLGDMPHRQVGGYNKLLYLADMMEALPEELFTNSTLL